MKSDMRGGIRLRTGLTCRFGAALLGAFMASLVAPGALAAEPSYPSGPPVRMVVPFAPGGIDIVARIVATAMSQQPGVTALVENKPGGNSYVAGQLVAHSPPDGRTLLVCLDDTFTIVPHLTKSQDFDPNKDLTPVSMIGKILLSIVVNPALPVDSLPSLIAYAKANPNKLSYGSSGDGSLLNLSMELLKHQAHINIVHVPYRGMVPAITAAAQGEVQVSVASYGTGRGLIDAGKLRPIVVTGSEPDPALPNLPTTAKLGYPDVDATSWVTVAAPAGTPRPLINAIHSAISRVTASPAVRKQLADRYVTYVDMGPDKLSAEIARKYRLLGEAVRIAGAHVN